ncbi:type II toxin-antitoxin system VapC family toxin [Gloeobacter morelensis]|uniref:Ribonuclease VapC n=1 Tax=Gloeobacter morelensis MG652769 TaxID=2781736 RepID=A0ABY3PQB8_9CYAN|nr:type II toxin-antitoxin system VapC family toxin [Gloeobacter morelensis]UFP95809.1 type II toxin-antitoxin system VapC family toxin [Gloeobacter morelensis MG652769]
MNAYRYLLDTNIVSNLIRFPGGSVAANIARIGEAGVCTSIIVASELRFGAAKKGSMRLSAQLETVLSGLDVLPFEFPGDQHYATLRAAIERTGTPIGSNDMFIAAHALYLGLILVTDNLREFARIPGLSVENWLAP